MNKKELDEWAALSRFDDALHKAPEKPPAPDKVFTYDELELLSNALIIAIQSNNEAAKLTASREVVEAIGRSSKALAALNTKICDMMEE